MKRWGLVAIATIFCAGCFGSKSDPAASTSTAPREHQPLRVCVIDDNPLAQVIQREWQGATQQPIELQELTTADVAAGTLDVDVVIYPSRMLGQFVAARQIIPFPAPDDMGESPLSDGDVNALTAASDYDWDDVLPWLRRHELRWNDQLYGVSFGSPQLLLAYRRDWFEQWQLKPPSSWTEYQAMLPELQTRLKEMNADSAARIWPTAEPLGENWAAPLVLARAAAYARHPNQYSTLFQFSTMTPWIDQPPFVRALQELIASKPYQSPTAVGSPEATMAELLHGRCAMAITWPSAAMSTDNADTDSVAIEFALLPGSPEVYSVSDGAWQPRASGVTESVPLFGVAGRIGSIARRARSPRAASDFLIWLTRKDESQRISTRSVATTLFRQSQTPQAQQWLNPQLASQARQYVDILLANQQRSAGLILLRIPGQQAYLQLLGQEVADAYATGDSSSADAALQRVATGWQAITAELGLAAQRQAYLESLGLSVN
ncbi:MAG: carbohydrate ABC transporter substrate-binding protein [Planctomycetales bacterium]|nr:carbohydrate ABC transporter substrate-binding protein [Planctomycetales bacterium]